MWKNSICIDAACTSANRCCHMGPRGEMCYFNHERALCALLSQEWKPELAFDDLIALVAQRLAMSNLEVEQLTSSIAQRMKPEPRHPLVELRDAAKEPE